MIFGLSVRVPEGEGVLPTGSRVRMIGSLETED